MRDARVLDRVVGAGLEVALDLHVEVEPAVAGQRVEQVVEEADAGRARARAVAVERQRQADVGLVGGAGDVRAAGHARRSIDSAWTGKPSARARAAPAGARRAAAPSGNDTRAIRRRKVAADSADWKRAAPPVGSTWLEPGHVVAERRGGVGAHEQAARARAPRRPAPRSRRPPAPGARARCASASAHRRARVARRAPGPAAGPPRSGARAPCARPRPAPRRAAPAIGGDQRQQAVVAVLGLRQQVEREQLGVGAGVGHHHQLAGARDPVDAHRSRPPGAWPPARSGCPGRRSRRPERTDSVPYASAAIAWAPPIR